MPSASPWQAVRDTVIVRPSGAIVRTWRVSQGLPPRSGRPAVGSPVRFVTPMSPLNSRAASASCPDRASTIVLDSSVISTNALPPMSSMRSTRTTPGELAGTAGPVGVAVGGGADGDGVAVSGGGTTDGCPMNPPTVATAERRDQAGPARPRAAAAASRPANPPPAIGSRPKERQADRAGAGAPGHGRAARSIDRSGARLGPSSSHSPRRRSKSFVAVMPVAPSRRGAGVGFEGGPERPGRVVEAGAGRADRDAEDVGDLGERQAGVVLEDEDRPLLRREPAEAALELVAVGDRADTRPAPGGVGVVGEQPDERRRRAARAAPRPTLARTITR